MEKIRIRILEEFEKHFSEKPLKVTELKKGVSEKLILRIYSRNKPVIGIYNRSIPENKAFFAFSKSFSKVNLKIPKVLYADKSSSIYFVTDAGRRTLYDYICTNPGRDKLIDYYKKAIRDLIDFQEYGKNLIDLKYCYETKYFDEKQIQYDINRFLNYFAGKYLRKKCPSSASDIMRSLIPRIRRQENYFMYRDFQPRNIIKNGRELYYLDYQSGRLGPPQYDLVSFLYSGSIDIKETERKALIGYYYTKAAGRLNFDEVTFKTDFKYFVLLRIMQILGSYCFSGFERGMTGTLKKIPKAVKNLKRLEFDEPELKKLKKFVIDSYTTRISKRR